MTLIAKKDTKDQLIGNMQVFILASLQSQILILINLVTIDKAKDKMFNKYLKSIF